MVLTAVLAYVSLQVVFGLYASRRIHTEDDYLIGGRRIGPALATFSIFATWFGAETCIGAASQAYSGGLSALAVEPFGFGVCLLLMGLIFAGPLWRLRLTTLADLFRDRFGVSAERLSVLLMVPTSILWAAAQIRAFGQILAFTSHLEVELAVLLAAVVVIVYTSLGGFLADAVSDLVQGLVLAIGLVILALVMVSRGGAELSFLALPAERFRAAASSTPTLDLLELLAVPILGSIFAQELVARVVAARSAKIARRSSVTAAGIYFFVGLIPVALGLAGAGGGLELDHSEQVLVHMAEIYLPGALFIIFAGALISAILSTVDSALLVSGSLVAHNLVLKLWPTADQKRRVRVNRIAVVAAGVVAYGLTLSNSSVWDLVIESSGFGSAGIFVAVVIGMYTRFGGERSAIAALLAGVFVWVWTAHLRPIDHPFLVSLGASFVAYALFATRGLGSHHSQGSLRSNNRG
ncbi:MAG: sodium:solute symporter family protein [Acidobacteriota bacterium]